MKIRGWLFCRKSFNSLRTSQTGYRLRIFGKKVIVVKLCSSHCILSGNTWFLFVLLLVMLTTISIRCRLASVPTVKLSFFLLQSSHVCGEVLEPYYNLFLITHCFNICAKAWMTNHSKDSQPPPNPWNLWLLPYMAKKTPHRCDWVKDWNGEIILDHLRNPESNHMYPCKREADADLTPTEEAAIWPWRRRMAWCSHKPMLAIARNWKRQRTHSPRACRECSPTDTCFQPSETNVNFWPPERINFCCFKPPLLW